MATPCRPNRPIITFYVVTTHTPQRALTALLGQGVKPSLTPELHEREAARHGLRYVYKVVELDDGQLAVDELRRLLNAAVQLGFDALNVTHPIKQAMVALVDDVTPVVEAIGALNTVLVEAATARGCRVLSGAGMAVHQAADTFELITGRPAHRDAMFHDFDEMVALETRSREMQSTAKRSEGQ